jgi:hypothetical protein
VLFVAGIGLADRIARAARHLRIDIGATLVGIARQRAPKLRAVSVDEGRGRDHTSTMKLAVVQRPLVFVFERLAILLFVVALSLALSGGTAYAFRMAHGGGGFAGGFAGPHGGGFRGGTFGGPHFGAPFPAGRFAGGHFPNHFDGHFHHGFQGHGFHNTFVFAFGFPFAPYYAYAPYPYYYSPYCNPYLPYYYPGSCYRYRY